MKKVLSVLIVGCMLLTMLSFPATAVEPGLYSAYYSHIKVEGSDINFSDTNVIDGTTVKSGLVPLLNEGSGYRIIPAYGKMINWPNGVVVPHKGNVAYLNRNTAVLGGFISSPNTPEDTEVGSLKMVSSAGYDCYVATLNDANGNPILAKANTEYVVRIAYVQQGAGLTRVNISAGRKTANATTTQAVQQDGLMTNYSTSTAVENSIFDDFNASRGTFLGSLSEYFYPGVQYATFNFITGDMSDAIPEFNLVITPQGLLGRYDGTHYAGVPQDENGGNKWTSSNWGRYKIVGIPEFKIKSIEFMEVNKGETVVSFVKSDEEILKKATAGVEFSASNTPSNFEGKWYKTTVDNKADNVISAFPYAHAYVYDFSALEQSHSKREYLGSRGIYVTKCLDKDVLRYKPFTYHEYYLEYNTGLSTGKYNPDFTIEEQLADMNKVYTTELWNMYRVPTDALQNGKTYKVTVTYMAPTAPNGMSIQFSTGSDSSAVANNNYLGNLAVEQTDEWVTKSVYFVANLPTTITESDNGLDDTFTVKSNILYLNPYSEIKEADIVDDDGILEFAEGKRPELLISEIKVEIVEDALTAGGAACLKDDVATDNHQQAIRMFFNYKTSADGSKIIIDGNEFEIVSRGVIYKDGSNYATNNTFDLILGGVSSEFNVDNKTFIAVKDKNFTNCWDYNDESGVLTYSNYITGFDLETQLNLKLIARGFVEYVGEDGATHILYSAAINRSVNGIRNSIGGSIENF